MWRSNDILKEERPSMSSDDFLQQPELQNTHSDAVCSIMEEKIVEGIEEETNEKMDCKDKQDIQSLANQSQESATEYATNKQQEFLTEMSLNDSKGEPGSKNDPVSNIQASCGLACPRCERRFTSSQGLERHMQTHAHTQHFKCSRCRRTFSTLFSRRRHEKRHENRNRKPDHRSNTTCGVGPNMPGGNEPVNQLSKRDKILPKPNPVRYNTSDGKQKGAANKNNDAKALNICKYCKKAFRTHTSLRRHQRRIHERQLLPKRLCKNVTITQESEGQQLVEPAQDSQLTLPPRMENTSAEREYMVDISSNISENLSFYIDGKIVSSSAVSNCGLIQMTSEGSAMIGLNAVIISPAQITQAFNLEANTCTSDLPGQPSTKRRTSTPPLLPQIKTELESDSILTASSTSLSSLSLSSTSLVATHLPESTETVAFHGERTVYLSPKLKQLLQNQDGKPALALIADGQKLSSPLSLTVLPPTTKFKRRTTSPPSSPQQSTDLSVEIVTTDTDSAETEESMLDNRGISPGLSVPSNDEVGHLNPTTKNSDGLNMQQHILPLDCSVTVTGGNSCNLQPLDLSNSVGKKDSNEALAESILDLSISGKSLDCDSEGVYITQPALRKSKPNSIMLQKVLMSECSGVDIPSLDVPGIFGTPDLTNFAIMALPDSGPPNPEKLLFEFTLPSSSLDPTTSLLAPLNIHTAAPMPPPQAPSSSSPPFVSFLSTPAVEPNQVQTLCSTLLVSDTAPSLSTVDQSIDNPIHLTQGDLKVTIPDWVSSAPGGVTHTLIPTAPPLSLQGPHWVSDPALCELAQRTLIVDSVLASDAQIFSPPLPVNQSDVTPLTFPPNTVVIEYTVALQSSENIQTNSVLTDNLSVDTTIQQEPFVVSQPQSLSLENSTPLQTTQPTSIDQSSTSTDGTPTLTVSISDVKEESKEELKLNSVCSANANIPISDYSKQENKDEDEDESSPLHSFCKNFMCNVCEQPFQSMKSLSQHVSEHSKDWPYKCEFCVQLFDSDTGLLEHRSSYHGIGKIYVCKTCSKEFAFLCNLEQHQRDLHPGQECSHTEVVHGKLRPENHNNPKTDIISAEVKQESDNTTSKAEMGDSSEELYTTIKIMASGGVKPKGPDVRMGINQHYPSFRPPPFPYHNRTPTGTTTASATNFTTHNIPQTFSTAIRCTKCGKSFDNMPELHKHILACANASDKKRYTPKKNPIPLKQFAEAQNGVLSPAKIVNSRQNLTKKLSFHESHVKIKMSILNKKKSQLMQKSRHAGGRKAFSQDDLGVYACPHCSREFTYNASLRKHVAFSCPMRPAIGKTKKRNLCIVSAQENNGSLRRQISNPHGSNHGPKMITKSQINKSNTAVDSTQNIRLKRSTILSTSAVQSSQKGSFIPQIVLSSPAQVNSQETGVRVHVLGNKMEQRVEDGKIQPRREERLSLRLRKRAGGPVTRSTQPSTATTVLLKQSDSHNIIMRPVVLQVKK